MNQHCMKKGHYWKKKLGGWLCDHCHMFVLYSKRFTVHKAPNKKYKLPL